MNSISTYIFRQTAFVMIFVTVVLSFVIWLTQSLRFVDMVVNRGLPITDFLWLPHRLYIEAKRKAGEEKGERNRG